MSETVETSSTGVVCIVRIAQKLDVVQRAERENPDVIGAIGTAAQRYMIGHRRTVADNLVIDIDEFARREDYDAFIAEAAPAIARYGELIGAVPEDTVLTVVNDD